MRRTTRLIAASAAIALVAGACGSSKSSSTTAAPATTAATATSAASATTEAPATTAASADLDTANGKGAAAWNAALDKADKAPQKADESNPIVIEMTNLEGAAGGSFPEIREGAQAAVKFINEKLGGVGATADKPGRAIKFEVCVHGLTVDEAQACANKVKAAKPAMVINGIDFFSPAMYPIWTGIPVTETVPIFVADFNTPGVFSAFGGCVSSFPGGAAFMKDYLKADKAAIIYSDNAPGQQCYADTEDRFYTQEGIAHIGIKDAPGDPADNDANAQAAIDYLKDAKNPAVYFGIQASDCAAYMKALNTAGYKGKLVVSGSCADTSVLSIPESKGVIFDQQAYIVDQPKLYSDFVQREIASREQAIKDYGPKASLGAFMRVAFSGVVFAYQIMNDVVAAGGDPSDNATLLAALGKVDTYHIVASPPVSCSTNAPDYKSVCKKSLTYTTWDGSQYVPFPGLDGKYIDLTDLLKSIPPRKAS